MKSHHALYMLRALSLARRGKGHVRPNPMVGCVVVNSQKIVGEGYHARYGGPHAEVVALKKAGKKARGATIYLTIEPCTHWGKTPPCLPQVIHSGIKRAYIAMADPNPLVSAAGIRGLREAGVYVSVGLQNKAARALNKPFLTRMATSKLPRVILKMAMTLDGKTATRTGDSKWISSPTSRKQVHKLRSQVDAVLVGAQTAIDDDPSLTSHGVGKNPLRVVLDPHLRTPVSLKMYNDRQARTLLVTSDRVPSKKLLPYQKRGVQILRNSLKNGFFELKTVMNNLYKNNVNQLLIEGGEKTASSFMAQNLINETLFFVAPKLIGNHRWMSEATRMPGPDIVIHRRLK